MKIVDARVKGLRKDAVVATVFLALTLVMTFPLVLHLSSGLKDLGDPLLNSWILSWNVKQITHLGLSGYFNANIFFPNKRTLAYSEHLFPQSLVALPILLIFGRAVLAHNIVLLFAYFSSAWGMYALARHLTKSRYSGFVAGIIFAFSPFMFSHINHLQVLTAGGIPLSFLSLHKYFENGRTQDACLFGVFYSLQALANGYYALYLALFGGLFMIIQTIVRKKFLEKKFWLQMSTALAIVLVLVGPFAYQYLQFQKEMNFSRNLGAQARPTSFLAATPSNRIYGRITARFQRPERHLFPGVTAFLLALAGFASGIQRKKSPITPDHKKMRLFIWLRRMLNLLIILWTALAGAVFLTGGFRISIGGFFQVSLTRLRNPVLTLLVLLFLRLILAWDSIKKRLSFFKGERGPLAIYGLIALFSILLTFGSPGPYDLLYKHVPGFNGLRVPARFHIFVMFSLAVLAAFGIRSFSRRIRRKTAQIGLVLIGLIILAEYASFPLPLVNFPADHNVPEVYRWLASIKNEKLAALELPLPPPGLGIGFVETPRMYFSTYHWHSLVNGYSGFFPPVYAELLRRWRDGLLDQNINDARELGVRYLIIHSSEYARGSFDLLKSQFQQLPDDLRFVAQHGEALVYELIGQKSESPGAAGPEERRPVSSVGWRAGANVSAPSASLAIDGNLATRWPGRRQQEGDYFELDMGTVHRLRGLCLKLGSWILDYPRGYRLDLSLDGQRWIPVAKGQNSVLPIRSYLKPKDMPIDFYFRPQEARYIRISLTTGDVRSGWSISELEVFE
jgi:hypothetical protein